MANKDYPIKSLLFQPLLTAPLHAQNVYGNILSSAGIEGFITLTILAFLMTSLACINYMNIAVASAANRLKEIGVRKVLGSARKQIVIQFFIENLIICCFAIVLGILWTEVLFLPGFNILLPNPLVLEFNDVNLWIFILVILVITTLGGQVIHHYIFQDFNQHPYSGIKLDLEVKTHSGVCF